MQVSIPNTYVNPNVRAVGVSKLRKINAATLRDLDQTLVIQENEQPLAVLLNYDDYMRMQAQLMAFLETKSVLSNKEEAEDIASGLNDINQGKTESFKNLRRSLEKGKGKS